MMERGVKEKGRESLILKSWEVRRKRQRVGDDGVSSADADAGMGSAAYEYDDGMWHVSGREGITWGAFRFRLL